MRALKLLIVGGAVIATALWAIGQDRKRNVLFPLCYDHLPDKTRVEKCVKLEAEAAGWNAEAAWRFNTEQRR